MRYRVQWVTNNCCMNQRDFDDLAQAEAKIAELKRRGVVNAKLIELKPKVVSKAQS